MAGIVCVLETQGLHCVLEGSNVAGYLPVFSSVPELEAGLGEGQWGLVGSTIYKIESGVAEPRYEKWQVISYADAAARDADITPTPPVAGDLSWVGGKGSQLFAYVGVYGSGGSWQERVVASGLTTYPTVALALAASGVHNDKAIVTSGGVIYAIFTYCGCLSKWIPDGYLKFDGADATTVWAGQHSDLAGSATFDSNGFTLSRGDIKGFTVWNGGPITSWSPAAPFPALNIAGHFDVSGLSRSGAQDILYCGMNLNGTSVGLGACWRLGASKAGDSHGFTYNSVLSPSQTTRASGSGSGSDDGIWMPHAQLAATRTGALHASRSWPLAPDGWTDTSGHSSSSWGVTSADQLHAGFIGTASHTYTYVRLKGIHASFGGGRA
jgi:hypothetical protein